MGTALCKRRGDHDAEPLTSFVVGDPWSIDDSLELCDENEWDQYEGKVPLLDCEKASSRASAVKMLNEGSLTCSEGFCAVYAVTRGAYFILFKPEAKQTALDSLGTTEEALVARAVARKPLQAGHYRVVLDRSQGESLGVAAVYDISDCPALRVDGIKPGLVKDWNDNTPNQAVKLGDYIVEVNGVRNNVDALVEECKKDQVLHVVFKRGTGPQPIANRGLLGRESAAASSDECLVNTSGTSDRAGTEEERAGESSPSSMDATGGSLYCGQGDGPKPEEYFVTLDRSSGTAFGMRMQSLEGNPFLIVEGITGGLAQSWNESHPETPIKTGDLLVEANGVSGEVSELIRECKKEEPVRLKMVRGVLPESCEIEGSS